MVDDLAKASTGSEVPTEEGRQQEEEKYLRAEGTDEERGQGESNNNLAAPGADAATSRAPAGSTKKADDTTDTRGRMLAAWDWEEEAKRVEAAQKAAQREGPASPHKAAGEDRSARK